jgi:hypothetical protein
MEPGLSSPPGLAEDERFGVPFGGVPVCGSVHLVAEAIRFLSCG